MTYLPNSNKAELKRNKLLLIALIMIVLLMSGCISSEAGSLRNTGKVSSSPTVFSMDVRTAGERLHKELEYRDSLEELDPMIVYTLLGIDEADVVEIMNYFSSGATAEEIIVLKAAGKEALETIKAIVVARIEDQKNVYVSYAPEEVNYLKGAIVELKDDYLIYCVPSDSQAGAKLEKDIFAGR